LNLINHIKSNDFMKHLRSLPGKTEFFEVYARLAKSIAAAGIFAQVVSAATEASLIYALSFAAVSPILPDVAPYVAALTAAFGVILIEGGLRVTTPQAVDAVLHRRYAGLHAVMTAAVFAVVIGLGGASGWLSFSNSTAIVEGLSAGRFDDRRAEAAERHKLGLEAAATTYKADSAGIAAMWGARIADAELAAELAEGAAEGELANIRRREARTGESYATQKDAAKAELAALRAKNAADLAALRASASNELSEAKNAYRAALAEIEAKNEGELAAITAEQSAIVGRYGGQLGWFTIVCLLVFFSSVVLRRVHAKGSEITETVELSQYDINPPWYEAAAAAISERVSGALYHVITQYADATPAPPLPAKPAELYDPTKLGNVVVEITLKDASERKPIEIEPKRRPIGFNAGAEPTPNAMRYSASGGEGEAGPKHCENCGLPYTPRVTWQKFCTTQCKDAHHASQHGGQKFEPGAYRGSRKRRK
jgi:hypothetical protein